MHSTSKIQMGPFSELNYEASTNVCIKQINTANKLHVKIKFFSSQNSFTITQWYCSRCQNKIRMNGIEFYKSTKMQNIKT